MALLGLLKKPIGAVLKAVGLIHTPNDGKLPVALPTVTRDDAAAAVSSQDELRKRRGGAADILNGASGAEAALTGGKLTLGS